MSAVTVTYHELPPLNSWAATGIIPCDGFSSTSSSNGSTDGNCSNLGDVNHASTSSSLSEEPHSHMNMYNHAEPNHWPYTVGNVPVNHDMLHVPLQHSHHHQHPSPSPQSQTQQSQHMNVPQQQMVPSMMMSLPVVCSTPCSTPASVDSPMGNNTNSSYWSPTLMDSSQKGFMNYNSAGGHSLLEQSLMSIPVSTHSNCMATSNNNNAEELCLVCGDKASGYHYNALTCEGCKGFFRRSITRKAVYYCKYGGQCDIDMYMRRKCQCCRLRKCMLIGMRPERLRPDTRLSLVVIPEDQCRMKREAKRAIRQMNQQQHQLKTEQQLGADTATMHRNLPAQDLDSIGSSTGAGTNMSQNGSSRQHSTSPPVVSSSEQELYGDLNTSPNNNGLQYSGAGGNNQMSVPMPSAALSQGQRELVNRLVAYQQQFDSPTDEALANLSTFHSQNGSNSSFGPNANGHTPAFQHLAELTILNVQLIVEFTKLLPGFSELCQQDQLTLQKACATEILMLRTARCYDSKSDSLVLGNSNTSWAYTRQQYRHAGMGQLTEAIYDFSRTLSRLKLDIAEYALLTAVAIFSERSNLLEPKRIEDIQEVYTSALQHYIEVHRPKQRTFFARLLMKLTDLRSLGSEQADVFCALKLDGTTNKMSDYDLKSPINNNNMNAHLKRKLSTDDQSISNDQLLMNGGPPMKMETHYEQHSMGGYLAHGT